MSLLLGLNAVTARNTGTTAAPVWVIMTNIKDETINMETALSDVTTRAANGWRLQVGTLSEGSIDTQILYDTEDADFQAIMDAFMSKSRILMGFFDDDPAAAATTVNGLVGGFGVTNFTINRQLEEAVMVDVTFTARENDEGNGPSWEELVNP